MERSKKSKQTSPLFLMLFALPFAGVGVGFLLFSIIPSLYEWQQMASWRPVQATVLSAELETHRGDDSTTYQAVARYRYSILDQQLTLLDEFEGATNPVASTVLKQKTAIASTHKNQLNIDFLNAQQKRINRVNLDVNFV